jgi:high-affinity iron transporter
MIGENGQDESIEMSRRDRRESRSSRWALFILPLITLLREGLEAVVFVGGVSLNTSAKAIPLPVVVGLIAGGIVGYLIYRTGSSATLHWFLIASTTLLLLVGAGLFSKGIGFLEYYKFAKAVGGDVAETGDGPGSFYVPGNVWKIPFGNPETGSPTTNGGWQIFNAIFGWNNTASLGTILGYCFYWIAVIFHLIFLKWQEGRFAFFGQKSAAYKRRETYAANRDLNLGAAPRPMTETKADAFERSSDSTRSVEEGHEKQSTVPVL